MQEAFSCRLPNTEGLEAESARGGFLEVFQYKRGTESKRSPKTTPKAIMMGEEQAQRKPKDNLEQPTLEPHRRQQGAEKDKENGPPVFCVAYFFVGGV